MSPSNAASPNLLAQSKAPEEEKMVKEMNKTGGNFIGLPPNMTSSSHRSGEGPEFVDEEEEEEN